MRLALGSLATAVLVAAALPGAAPAATWSAPQDLSAAHLFAGQPRLLFARDGAAMATWTWTDGVGNDGRSGASLAPRAPGADAFGAVRALVPGHRIDRGETIVPPAGSGRRGVLLASTRPVGSVVGQRVRLSIRRGTVDGRFGRARTLRTAKGIRSVQLVTDAGGDAALAWFEDRGVRNDRVYVALRRAGHGFGAPRRLATGRIRSVAAAIGADRDVLVAWDARGTVKTRFKPRGRAAFYPTDTIRSEPAFFADLHPVVTVSGRAAVAWSAQFASEGGSSGPAFFQVAVRAAGNRRFRRARLLERLGREQVARPIDAVEGAPGDIDVAWSGTDGATRVVKAARFGDRLAFTPPAAVSPAGTDALLSDLAAGGGRLIAVWDNGSSGADQVFAALSTRPGEPFGPAEAVSPAQQARDGHAAFDPRTHRPTVVWTNRPAGSDGPVEQVKTFAQAATRAP